MNGEVSVKKTKPEVLSSPHQLKGHSLLPDISSIEQANSSDPASLWPKSDKSGNEAQEVLRAKSSFHNKRKNSTLGSKSKRLRIEKEDVIQLKLTWEQAQGLLRPPPNHVPSVVVIDGFEFEEYEVQYYIPVLVCLKFPMSSIFVFLWFYRSRKYLVPRDMMGWMLEKEGLGASLKLCVCGYI